MVGETVRETWFGNIWKTSRKSLTRELERPILGILAFEISKLMSKVVTLWQCLDDRHMVRLREEIASSVGIHRLISDDDDHLMDLALVEIVENLGSVVKSVVMLGKKCTDSKYHDLEQVFDDTGEVDPKWSGWRYRPRKMEKKIKKMESFVAATEQLYQELDVLAELEQSLRRMRSGSDLCQVILLEFQQKVVRQQLEVKNLRDMSPCVRTYDYVVRLLLRSIFAIMERIHSVNGIMQIESAERNNSCEQTNVDCVVRSNSLSAPTKASIHPSETKSFRFTVPLGRSFSNLGLGSDKSKSKNMKSNHRSESAFFCGKQHPVKARVFAPVGFGGCMTGGTKSPVIESCTPSSTISIRSCNSYFRNTRGLLISPSGMGSSKATFLNSKSILLHADPSTLGYTALSHLYANIIILIEKLAQSPHLISTDARDDLYDMLSATIKSRLRARLKTFSRSFASYDTALAAEWSLALANILEWLSPLAYDTLKWQSERNFERQRLITRSNVLLVQTLYFANQAETEAAIVELLVGLNYLSRFSREPLVQQLSL